MVASQSGHVIIQVRDQPEWPHQLYLKCFLPLLLFPSSSSSSLYSSSTVPSSPLLPLLLLLLSPSSSSSSSLSSSTVPPPPPPPFPPPPPHSRPPPTNPMHSYLGLCGLFLMGEPDLLLHRPLNITLRAARSLENTVHK